MSNKRVFNMNIAMKLIRKGHDLVKCEPHRNGKSIIFLFENTEQLQKDLYALINK